MDSAMTIPVPSNEASKAQFGPPLHVTLSGENDQFPDKYRINGLAAGTARGRKNG
jgi:hypothetical protein